MPDNRNDQGQPREKLSDTFNKNALRWAWLYLWPFSLTAVFKALWAQRYILPVIAAQQVIQTATIYAFPTADEFLREKGLDPAVAQQLSDTTVRVRHRNIPGLLSANNDFPTLLGMGAGLGIRLNPVQAYALQAPLSMALGQCPVLLQDDSATARDSIAALADLSAGDALQIERMPLSDRESALAVAFHEFRHCDSQNGEISPEFADQAAQKAEADADEHGLRAAAKAFNNPEIFKVFTHARALNMSAGSHDTALYLATPENERPALMAYGMERPTREAFGLLKIYMANEAGISFTAASPAERAVAMWALLKEHGNLFSPYARKRAELYIEAARYFFPTAFAHIGGATTIAPVPLPFSPGV